MPQVNTKNKVVFQHLDLTDHVVFDFQQATIDLVDPKHMVQQVLEQVITGDNKEEIIYDMVHRFKRTTMGFRYKTEESLYLILYLK